VWTSTDPIVVERARRAVFSQELAPTVVRVTMSIRDGGDICLAANERQSGLVPNEPPQIPSTAFLMMEVIRVAGGHPGLHVGCG
jgi:hypothetical protein